MTPKKQAKLQPMITTKDTAHEIELQMVRFIVATNSPFSLANNGQFLKLVERLRPGFKVPDRRVVAGPLLDAVYNIEKEKVCAQLKGHDDEATLSIDGWSNINNSPVIGVAIIVNGRTYLIDTVDTVGRRHTSDYLCELVEHYIGEAKEQWGVNVTSIVTDNASNMSSMRSRLEEKSAPDSVLLCFGCHAHLANLLSKDICSVSRNESVVLKINQILKWLRNNHAAGAELVSRGICRPSLPAETRWNTVSKSL